MVFQSNFTPYQNFWEIIEKDIMNFQQGWLNISRLNCGVIKLVPKVKEPTNIGKFRPICLQNMGGNGSDVGWIVSFTYPFSYF
jgi:hypothetical protein